MATEPVRKTHNFGDDETKMLRRALSKLEQSTGRFLTTAQKEEDDKSIASSREQLALIAILKTKL